MQNKTIILIDDDEEDIDMVNHALKEMKITNEVRSFTDSYEALDFLKGSTKSPFFILCDINMPKLNGLELRQIIFNDPQLKMSSIPFLFFSTSQQHPDILNGYVLGIQGYFIKPHSIEEMKKTLECIIGYWSHCLNPNNKKSLKM